MSNILLLQGPMGPFLKLFQKQLNDQLGVDVHRILLNGGDELYAGKYNVHPFLGAQEQWADFLNDFIQTKQISHIVCYGDCRFYHKVAAEMCEQLGIRFWALEEGYLRPNYVTCEEFGANANSKTHYEEVVNWSIKEDLDNNPVSYNLLYHTIYTIIYYLGMFFGRNKFKQYKHHRDHRLVHEATAKVISFYRHCKSKCAAKFQHKYLEDKPFFLVPLQVFNDSQLTHHSSFHSMSEFIELTVKSFASNANDDDILVIKHHPYDRGECHYGKTIADLGSKYQVEGRLMYVHDLHLPTLLKLCKGIVSINSTTVFGAFHHGAPVKIVGEAFYDLKGLASECDLDQFWQSPSAVDHDLYLQLRDFLRHTNQFNGSFYSDKNMAVNNVVRFFKGLV